MSHKSSLHACVFLFSIILMSQLGLVYVLLVTYVSLVFPYKLQFVVLKKPWAVGDGNMNSNTTFQWAVVVLKLIRYDSFKLALS